MLRKMLLVIAAAFAMSASAAPFLICDVLDARADTVLFTRGTTTLQSSVVVDVVNGKPVNGNRICKIDLATDPRTGTVTVAVKDSVLGDVSPNVSFAFPGTLSAPTNLRVIP